MTNILTDHFKLTAVKGETPSINDWAAVYWNWITADALLYGAVMHEHTGAAALSDPTGTLVATTAATGGTLPASTEYFFVVTYLDALGRETGKSSEATVTTTAAIAAPATPTNNDDATPTDIEAEAVALVGGSYWYKIAYTKGSGETTCSAPLYVEIPTDQTYAATIHFASLTEAANGADSIIIYRKYTSAGTYNKLIAITNTATNSYRDNDTATPDCTKHPVAVNTTNAFSTITIDWSGLDWNNAASVRIFVNTVSSLWTSTTNKLVTATLDMATPVTSYVWTGTALLAGRPPVSSECLPNPDKIDLATEVTGKLTTTTVADVSLSASPTEVELKINELLGVLRDSGVINE